MFSTLPIIDLDPESLAYSRLQNGVLVQVLAPPEISNGSAFAAQCAHLFALDVASRHDVGDKLGFLGFSFCVVITDTAAHRIFIASGANSLYRLYFREIEGRLQIADALPPRSPGELAGLIDRQELVRFLAGAWSSGPFELKFSSTCIRSDWQRLPNAHYQVFDRDGSAGARSFDNIFQDLDDSGLSLASAIEALRHALDEHLRSLASLGGVAAEFSGGIDSGIVYARARALLGERFVGGVTADYPFSEFAREQPFRDAILAQSGGRTHAADPMKMLPFCRLKDVPCHDEPSVGSTSWGQFSEAVATAARAGARVLLNGHGGDLAFLVPPGAPLAFAGLGETPDWIPRRLADEIAGAAETAIGHMNAFHPALSGYWHPGMFEAGYLARYANAEHPTLRYTSGLVSREVARAALRLWRLDPLRARHLQKPVAHAAFGDDLPASVWTRPGKVNHIGNVFRGAKAAARDILDIVDAHAQVLEIAGIAPARLRAHAAGIVNGRRAPDQLFSQALAVLIWVHCSIRPRAPAWQKATL